MQRANEQVFVAVQIENREALGNLESIAAIQGLDSLALGPYDLAVDLGHADELDHPEVLTAINRVIQVARYAGKHVGTGMGAYARGALDFAHLGLQWIQCGDDYGYMIAHADELMAQIRKQAANPIV
jgi:2-keto-3-deoxy-L-rhamnonate aldolase RhmA